MRVQYETYFHFSPPTIQLFAVRYQFRFFALQKSTKQGAEGVLAHYSDVCKVKPSDIVGWFDGKDGKVLQLQNDAQTSSDYIMIFPEAPPTTV